VARITAKVRGVPYVAAAGLALALWAWAVVRLVGGGGEDDIVPLAQAMRVNVNSADEAALQTLPGIGGTYARRIVAERDRHGAFSKPEDLLRIRGVTTELIEGIEPFIIFHDVKSHEADGRDRPETQGEGKARP
jgi:competence ComEA-like helix-hairpin-helix protein